MASFFLVSSDHVRYTDLYEVACRAKRERAVQELAAGSPPLFALESLVSTRRYSERYSVATIP